MASVAAEARRQLYLTLISALRQAFIFGLTIDQDVSVAPGGFAALIGRIRGKVFGFGSPITGSVSLDLLADTLEDPGERAKLRGDLDILLRCEVVRRTFELVKTYAIDTGQAEKFWQAPCAQYGRLARNVLSHGEGAKLTEASAGFLRAPTFLKHHPDGIEWRNQRVTAADIGTDLALGPTVVLELQGDLRELLLNLD